MKTLPDPIIGGYEGPGVIPRENRGGGSFANAQSLKGGSTASDVSMASGLFKTSTGAISFWFKNQSLSGTPQTLFHFGGGSKYIWVDVSTSGVRFGLNLNGFEIRTWAVATDTTTWHHLFFGSGGNIYVDNNLCPDGFRFASLGWLNYDTNNARYIMRRQENTTSGCLIYMDEFSVWQGDPTAIREEIWNSGAPGDLSSVTGYASNCLQWLRFESDSGSGANGLIDASGNGNHATMNANVSLQAEVP